jgi:hypothetical protein
LRTNARFAHRSGAKVGVRVQEPLQICLGCRSKSKNRDKQLTHIVRVSKRYFLLSLLKTISSIGGGGGARGISPIIESRYLSTMLLISN